MYIVFVKGNLTISYMSLLSCFFFFFFFFLLRFFFFFFFFFFTFFLFYLSRSVIWNSFLDYSFVSTL